MNIPGLLYAFYSGVKNRVLILLLIFKSTLLQQSRLLQVKKE